VGGGAEGHQEGKDRFKIRGLFADERCSQAVPDSLSTTDVGRRVPNPAEEGARNESSGWEPRERQEKGEERKPEAEEAGAEVEKRLQFFPTPSFLASVKEE